MTREIHYTALILSLLTGAVATLVLMASLVAADDPPASAPGDRPGASAPAGSADGPGAGL